MSGKQFPKITAELFYDILRLEAVKNGDGAYIEGMISRVKEYLANYRAVRDEVYKAMPHLADAEEARTFLDEGMVKRGFLDPRKYR